MGKNCNEIQFCSDFKIHFNYSISSARPQQLAPVKSLPTVRPQNACTLVPTVFRWHGKMAFKCHLQFSFSHDIEKQF